MTALYVPPTGESDHQKQNMSLQLIGGKTSENIANIATNTADIATNTANIATNTANIATNATGIATNTTNIASNTASINAMQAAWTTYTPTVTAGTGTFTTVSAAGRYLKTGHTVHLAVVITLTSNGTAASFIKVTLPFTGSIGQFVLAGRESNSTGKMIQGIIGLSDTVVTLFNYDGTYPGGTGFQITISGTYESA
jgi:hypothetical protein